MFNTIYLYTIKFYEHSRIKDDIYQIENTRIVKLSFECLTTLVHCHMSHNPFPNTGMVYTFECRIYLLPGTCGATIILLYTRCRFGSDYSHLRIHTISIEGLKAAKLTAEAIGIPIV